MRIGVSLKDQHDSQSVMCIYDRVVHENNTSILSILLSGYYAIINYEKYYKTILQPTILPALRRFTFDCIL